jgi:hypothetical protein
LAQVTIYQSYQSLVDALAERQGWSPHRLAVGEAPHASANPADFAAQRDKVIAALVEEAQAGNLVFNPQTQTGHLQRPVGSCVFCDNALYGIGPACQLPQIRAVGTLARVSSAP